MNKSKKTNKNTICCIIDAIIRNNDFIISNLNNDKEAWLSISNKKELKNKIVNVCIKLKEVEDE